MDLLLLCFALFITSQPGPGAARKKFDELTSPIWTFYGSQSFLSRDPFGVTRGPGLGFAGLSLC